MTPEQAQMVKDALGDRTSWPKMTNDPIVNHAVDREFDGKLPAWDELTEVERQIYISEARINTTHAPHDSRDFQSPVRSRS